MLCGPKSVLVVEVVVVCCPDWIVPGSSFLVRRSIGVSIRRSSGSDWGGVVVLEVSVCGVGPGVVCNESSSCCCWWW